MWERKGEENCNKLLFSASSQLISLWEEKKDSFTFTHETVLKISVWRSCGVLYYKLESRACGRIQSNQQSLRPCLDVVGFTSIHVFWCGLEWFFLKKILLQSTLTHVDWYESNYMKKKPYISHQGSNPYRGSVLLEIQPLAVRACQRSALRRAPRRPWTASSRHLWGTPFAS